MLNFQDFDTDVDIDEMVKINYSNIVGEILTISVFVNQIGLLRADHEAKVKEYELDLAVFGAQVSEMARKNISAKQDKPATVQQVENALLMDPIVQNKRKTLIRLQKEFAYIEALYVAVKSKDQKLNNLSRSLTPKDMEERLVEASINNTLVTVKKNSF
ncbi:MAG: hypothetical protein JHC54_10515 [Acinetobacter sp.]|nr:hypothetical protein [Acinetobacter sp.]